MSVEESEKQRSTEEKRDNKEKETKEERNKRKKQKQIRRGLGLLGSQAGQLDSWLTGALLNISHFQCWFCTGPGKNQRRREGHGHDTVSDAQEARGRR